MRPIPALVAALSLSLAACAAPPSAPSADYSGTTATLHKPDVPYEPSPPEVVTAMLNLAQVRPQDIVYDLGSGDGRIPIAAARDYGARGVGIEIDPKLVAESRENAVRAGVGEKVTIRNEDLFQADFSDATVVMMFLWPDINLKLRPKLLSVLKPGTRIVSYWHSMGNWKPERKIRVGRSNIYLWRIPENGAPAAR